MPKTKKSAKSSSPAHHESVEGRALTATESAIEAFPEPGERGAPAPSPVEGEDEAAGENALPTPPPRTPSTEEPKPSTKSKRKKPKTEGSALIGDDAYRTLLRNLQIELVKLQRQYIRDGERILVIFEGRDAAGKDGTIKRVTEHLSPRETRVVALGKPSDREQSQWYFQRYVEHLPSSSELVLFNRSWYNRAGVERVMGFCTPKQYEEFMDSVLDFEHMLVSSGIRLFKYYLDISKAEQKQRLDDRLNDPLTQWKVSPIDSEAHHYWDEYSKARDEMLARTHDLIAPWTIVRADHKKTARVQLIQSLLARLDYEGKDASLIRPDNDLVFEFEPAHLTDGKLAP